MAKVRTKVITVTVETDANNTDLKGWVEERLEGSRVSVKRVMIDRIEQGAGWR